MKTITKALKEKPKSRKYSNFFSSMPFEEQKKIIAEAARLSNEDQLKIYKQALLMKKEH